MSEQEGRFLVTHADERSAVLKDVDGGQVHTLTENPGVESGDLETRRNLTVEESPEPPTRQERELAADQPTGEVIKRERAGEGEIHVLPVPEEQTEAAVEDVLNDEATLVRAARLQVERVEIRSETGVVSVRYLP